MTSSKSPHVWSRTERIADATNRSPLYTGIPRPTNGTVLLADMPGNVNRHNPASEPDMRRLSQVLAFLVLKSKRAGASFCKMRAGRKGPVIRTTTRFAISAHLILLAGAAAAADVRTTPLIEVRA